MASIYDLNSRPWGEGRSGLNSRYGKHPLGNVWKGYGLSVAAIEGKSFVDGGSARGRFESRGGPSPAIDDLLKK